MSTIDSKVHIRIEGLYFSRGQKEIFSGIDLEFERSKITAVMGLSGSGKTTLLKLITAQLKPSAGRVYFDGLDMHRLNHRELYQQRKKIGILFQSGALLSDFSVFDNIAFPLREHTDLPEALIRNLVEIKLNGVGLASAHAIYPSNLSGGMARRVALARTLILDPSVVMYDEPFTGQDPINKGVVVRLIRSLNQLLDLTSIIVSHDILETCQIADYIHIIDKGGLVASGTGEELLASKDSWVDQFMNARSQGPVHFDYGSHPLAPGASNNSYPNEFDSDTR